MILPYNKSIWRSLEVQPAEYSIPPNKPKTKEAEALQSIRLSLGTRSVTKDNQTMVQATQQWSGDPVGKTMELQQWHVAVQPCRFPHQQGIARLTTGYPSRWPKIGPSDWTAKDIIRVYREHTSAILCSEARNGFLSPKEPFARSQDQLAVEVGECNTEGLQQTSSRIHQYTQVAFVGLQWGRA